ncbi:hypothetical protein Tco_0046263 [Tanacetum coccineum]
MPLTPDLSFIGLDEFVNEPAVENCKAMSSEEEPKVVRKCDDAPSIKEWVLDDEEEDVSQPKIKKKIVRPSIVKKEFVKSKQQEKTARKTVKQVEQHRQNTHSPRGNQRNWNNMMSQKLGSNFEMFNKACYVCGSFDHLQNMVPRAVLMKSGLVSINTARQNISKTTVLVNTARQVNTAHSKTTVNAARPMSYLSKIAHSTVKRPIHKNTTFKNSNINPRGNIVRGKKFNTARPKAVVNVVKGNNFNVVKASACWVWKPKHKVLDHVSKHNSNHNDLQDQGVIDSGCSRHMTGNMSYLTDYEEIDGGYVAFGGNPKGGKITRKGTQSNGFASTKASDNACQARKETEPVKDYILLPLWTTDPPYSQDPKSSHDDGSKPSSDDGKKVDEDPRKDSECKDQEKEDNVNNTNNVNTAVMLILNTPRTLIPLRPNLGVLHPTPDLSFIGLDEFVNEPVVENCKAMSSEEEPKVDRSYHQKQFQNQRMVKLVWNIAQRVNHQNFAKKTHPYTKKNLVSRAILMKSSLVSINTVRQNISKAAVLVNTARQVNDAHSKTTVNAARPMSYISKIAHLTVESPIHKNITFKYSNINQRVNTVRDKKFNTASLKAVVNAVKGNNFNDVKASSCWVWKPKHKVLDHGNPQMDLQDQGVIDSGCSSHMTGNMSYLTDYEEIDGGYVTFGGNPKGGKIKGKDTKSIQRFHIFML